MNTKRAGAQRSTAATAGKIEQQLEHSQVNENLPGTGSRAGKGKSKTAKAASSVVKLEIPKLVIEQAKIKLIGDSSLLCHKWSDKARKEILDKQMHRAKGPKQAKDPWMHYCDSLYWLNAAGQLMDVPGIPKPSDIAQARFGFPAIAFKSAAVDACSHVDGITKVEARGAFHINDEYVVIHGTPEMREDMVRIGMGTADIRYRGEFKQWYCEFVIRFNKNVLSLEQIVNLFNTAGFGIGIGEWRPAKDGSFGLFHVATEE